MHTYVQRWLRTAHTYIQIKECTCTHAHSHTVYILTRAVRSLNSATQPLIKNYLNLVNWFVIMWSLSFTQVTDKSYVYRNTVRLCFLVALCLQSQHCFCTSKDARVLNTPCLRQFCKWLLFWLPALRVPCWIAYNNICLYGSFWNSNARNVLYFSRRSKISNETLEIV